MIFFYENFHKFFHSFLFPKILKHCVSRIQNIGLDEGKQKIFILRTNQGRLTWLNLLLTALVNYTVGKQWGTDQVISCLAKRFNSKMAADQSEDLL